MPLENGTRCLGFAGGMLEGRLGREEVEGDEGSQRSGMKDQGSGYMVEEWWINGACMLMAVCKSQLISGSEKRIVCCIHLAGCPIHPI